MESQKCHQQRLTRKIVMWSMDNKGEISRITSHSNIPRKWGSESRINETQTISRLRQAWTHDRTNLICLDHLSRIWAFTTCLKLYETRNHDTPVVITVIIQSQSLPCSKHLTSTTVHETIELWDPAADRTRMHDYHDSSSHKHNKRMKLHPCLSSLLRRVHEKWSHTRLWPSTCTRVIDWRTATQSRTSTHLTTCHFLKVCQHHKLNSQVEMELRLKHVVR